MNGSINFDGTLSGSIAGGGGGGGSEVSITPVLTEGTKIADYSIDSTAGELYAPESGDTVEVTPTLNMGDKVADIEVNGVNKALYSQSYGYANNINDNNTETIGGLQKGSNITPIMVKAVSYADQAGADSETVGVLSVGDTDYPVKQKKTHALNYATTEQDTGKKWIDGRTVYQRVISGTTNTQAYYIPDTNDVAILISINGHIDVNNTDFYMPYNDGGDYITVANDTNGIRLYISNYFINKEFTVIIEYVKGA